MTTRSSEREPAHAQAADEQEAANEEPQEEPQKEPQEELAKQPQAPAPEPAERPDPTVAEMREVAQAERLLASDPEEALEITRRMRTRFEGGYFMEERGYIEVMALQKLRRKAELRTRATAFLRAYPQGPYSARVREALASAR